MSDDSRFAKARPYAEGGLIPPYTGPTTSGVIPTPVTAWQPLPVVLTEARLGRDRSLTKLIAGIGATFLVAWVLMLIVGALHNDVAPWLPPLGYWHTLLVLIGLRLVQRTPALWMLTEPRSRTTEDMVKTLGGKR